MSLSATAEKLRNSSYALIRAVRALHSLAEWSLGADEDGDIVISDLVFEEIGYLVEHILTGEQHIFELSEDYAAGYLELCKIDGSVGWPKTKWLAGNDFVPQSYHYSHARWYGGQGRKLLRKMRFVGKDLDLLDQEKVWWHWKEWREDHEEWARLIAPEWQTSLIMLGFERTNAIRLLPESSSAGMEADAAGETQKTAPPPAIIVPQAPADPPRDLPVVSSDGRNVTWAGHVFTFSDSQAKCFELLLSNYERGASLGVGTDALLKASGTTQNQVNNIFRSKGEAHPAWNTMIVPQSRGMYLLRRPTTIKPKKTTGKKSAKKNPGDE